MVEVSSRPKPRVIPTITDSVLAAQTDARHSRPTLTHGSNNSSRLITLVFLTFIFYEFKLDSLLPSFSLSHFFDAVSSRQKEPLRVLLDACGVPAAAEDNKTKANNANGNEEDSSLQFCSDEHRLAYKFCSRNNHNKVLMREGAHIRSWGELRQYSVTLRSDNLDSMMSPSSSLLLPWCHTLEEYLSAIKFGTRKWSSAANSTTARDDGLPSQFVPSHCYAPILPPPRNKTCALLNKYNHVIFHGDSLTRHLRQTMFMILKGDYVNGATMTHDTSVRNDCQCDGQFSEARHCRKFDGYFDKTMQPRDAPGEKLCPNSTFMLGKMENHPFLTRRGKIDPGEHVSWGDINCAEDDYKGAMIVAQGGLHWFSNATNTFEGMLRPIINHSKFNECLKHGKIRLIWQSMTSQSLKVDTHYPHQSRANALVFNKKIRNHFVEAGLVPGQDVLIMDWWNMTADAQSSDGVHYMR